MKRLGLLLVCSASLSFTQQAAAPVPLTEVPPKPTCTLIFKTGTCADSWRAYNRALTKRQQEEMQLYINRQKDLASAQATAPLQQQIADLNKLVSDQQAQIKKLSDQIQTDAEAALQAKSDAHDAGVKRGAEVAGGVGLFLLVVVVLVLKKKPVR
jgi:hypothetical protein